jgi:hypothetical protein
MERRTAAAVFRFAPFAPAFEESSGLRARLALRGRMQRLLPTLVVITVPLLMSAPSLAFAQGEYDRNEPISTPTDMSPKTGVQVGARVGFGVGTGSVYKDFGVSEGSNGFVPVVVDVGARVIPELYIGAYGGWAHVIPKTNQTSCPEGYSCSVNDWRFGVEADWHFMPRVSYDPYIGLSTGWDILHNSVSGSTQLPTPAGLAPANVEANVTDSGWEIVGLHLGADFRLGRALALGPFFTATLGRYTNRTGTTTVSVGPQSQSKDAPDVEHAMHEYYMLGVRGTINP